MKPKEQFYSAVARETINKLTSSRNNWTSFLTTLGRNYDFTYPEQVMIHAQRPDATVCKAYDDWMSDEYRRYVKRGSKGIALFVTNHDKPYLRYVFDVSDTGKRRTSPEIEPWTIKEEYRQPIQAAMEKAFGVASDGTLEIQLEKIAENLANEYWDEYQNRVLDIVANSYLEGYDIDNIEMAFRRAVAISVSYAMYSRCTDSPDDYFEQEDFANVFDFNSRQAVNVLGTAVNAVSSQMFHEIEHTITIYEQSKMAERSQNHDERNELHTERGLPHPEHRTERERNRNETPGQVWQNEEDLPGAEQSDAVQRPDSDREVIPASEGDRRDSDPQSGTADEPVPAEQSGTGQRDSADGVGSAHEQPESTGRGSSDDGAYQQLSLNLFLSEAEQIRFIDEAESRKPSAFSFTQEQIDHFLILGGNTDNHRMVVALEYAKGKSTEEIAQRLKEIYRGSNGYRLDGADVTAWFDDQCIHLARGKTARYADSRNIVSWQEAAERIGQLLESGEYATNVELVEAPGYERQQLAESLWYLYHDFADGVRETGLLGSMQFIQSNGFPSEIAELAEKLNDPEFRANLQNEYRLFMEVYKENPEVLRFHYHKLTNIEKRLNELSLPLREYQSGRMVPPLVRQFITDDEINEALTHGSGFAGGKGRIWNYWQEGHSSQEKAEFLKKEHGTGGRSHALSGATHSGEDHDAKGMRFKKDGCEEVKFSWIQVASRIDSLIANDRYLTEQEKAERDAILEAKAEPEIEETSLAEEVEQFEAEQNAYREKIVSGLTQEQKTIVDAWEVAGFPFRPNENHPTRLIFGELDSYPMVYNSWKDAYDAINGAELKDTPGLREKVQSVLHWDTVQEQMIKMDDPDRFSIRLHPNEGGITGIWDAALNRFYEEGNQVLRFAEQHNTIDYLANIQRTRGMEPSEPTFTTPTGKAYHIGDGVSSLETEHKEATIIIERVDEDYVWYTLPSVPDQEPVNINRESFERYLDTGYFSIVNQEQPVKETDEAELPENTDRYVAVLTSDAFELPFIIYDNKYDTYYETPDGFYRTFESEDEAKEYASQLNKLEERPALDSAKELIDRFCQAEYDSPADFSDLSQVGIGHTTVTDDEIPIQCYANLVDFRIERYLGETLIESRQSNSLEELIAHELENLDFSDLIYVTDEEVERYYEAESAWNYKVGDTVYLDDTAFLVEEVRDSEVQLRDPTLLYPIFRAENRSRFEELLARDERNNVLRKNTADEKEAVAEENQGEISPEVAQKPAPHRYLVAAYHHFENGFDDKLDYPTLAEAEKAAQGYVDGTMEDDGFKYDGAAVYDQQERKYVHVYGDYPDEKAHAQVNGVELVEPEVPENFIDHFYVADDLEVRGALSLKEYSTFEDALRAYHELPDTQMKALGAMNTARPFPGSLDFMQCKDGQDTIIEDYKKVAGWEHPEVQEVISKLETAIQTKAIPEVPASNYHITDDHIGEGGSKQKFARNIEAIETLFQLERENRNATPEEQEVLASYVGWGGLADAFDPDKGNWAQEYTTLKNLLSEDEYAAARASTLNAHYTSPTVIRAIYDAVSQMGFETGNILEPAMGIGNFFGMLPPEMQSSQLYGVELDSITGRIAQKLYPNAEIKVAGFETTDRRDFYDLAVGNVPFGNYKVADKPYDKLGFSIHNYFFAKSLDQVRPGGVVAFVTSRFTMDSKNSDARRYLAQRAEFLGAIRLPNDTFKKNAGTEVVSDIIFLQKRDHPIDIVPEWVDLNRTEDGFTMNSYFVDHPEMILGELTTESTQYGKDELTVVPREDADLGMLLKEAVSNIQGSYQAVELPEADSLGLRQDTIPARPDVKNFSYAMVNGEVYFRENSIMRHVDLNEKAKERVTGMVELRRIVNELIEYQLEDFPDEQISDKQAELNAAYDAFTAKNGLINNRANGQAFSDDSSYYLLCSLENVDEDGNLKSKADMFTKRTIKPERRVTSVDTPSEALAISIGERGKVDLPYMANLLGTPDEYDVIKADLRGVIFKDPMAPDDETVGWQTADEYLSGDVRSKLRIAQMAANRDSSFAVNVQALEKAQPKDLDASEIDVRLGATWIDPGYIQRFMEETFDTPYYLRRSIEVKFSEMTAEWRISGKSSPSYNDVAAYTTYGTDRANAYRILEETLNLKDIRIYDTIEDPDGKQKRVLNKKETTLAQQKQQAIKDAFRDWIWKDPRRREALVTKYNELFNSTRPREYDGSHIRFGSMNPDITLREHQKNAIAHVLYGGNTLLAHEVGAGKTFEMAASAMESKRLGLAQKSMFVVPNHLTMQWANEFLHLYPSAKLLVATKKDFETANRKKFCARIATGDYDAVIIGHSQFEKIPLSAERQERQLREQIDEIEGAIAELKYQRGENFSIKQMEKTRKSLQARLDKLTAADRKDDVVTFEQLGVDRLFVDESHAFKNLFLYTKMRNVAGLSTSEAQKSSDMFMKCRYMDELTGGRGVVFATGTPVSNSMTELYTVMRYLQYGTLQKKNLTHFDCWASTFGETSTAIELAPEGTGYRARTRFAKFFNLPELMNMFKEVADIKTADQLNLPVPEAKFETVVVQPSEHQKSMVAELSERAAAVHSGIVDPSEDNMLKITSDGRKLGLDQRLMNPLLSDDPDSKLNACVNNVLKIWQDGQADKLTQLVFCDLSTPKNDGTFNVYDDIKSKLLAAGVPAEEVAFIHDADTEAKKKELFAKVRTGQVRVLLGSTQKMGAGTNVQDKLVAVHHLDVGWRPSDMTQRNGRIIRQGNQNKEVQVFQYVTEGTFDAYLYQTLENKQKFISQIMTSKSPVRSCDDVDEQALSYAEIKALCAGNPLIKEKMDLDIDVARLKVLKADHQSQQYRLEDKLLKYFPAQIEQQTGYIHGFEADIKTVEANPQIQDGFCGMEILGKHYAEKANAGEIILAACKEMKGTDPIPLGSYRGFQMELSFDSFRHEFDIVLKGSMSHRVALGTDARGNLTRLDNALAGVPEKLESAKEQLTNLYNQQEAAKVELGKPFPQEAELTMKSQRLAELDAELNMEDTVESHSERNDTERPSVLADLKSKTEHIPPAKRSDNREEVL